MKKSYILALLTFLVLTLNVEGAESTACPGNAWPGAMSYLSQDEDVNSIIEKAQEAYNKGNHEEAVRLYRIAAERGNSLAQYRLGTRYFRGEGVNKSNEEAFKWWKRAAEQGNPDAQNNIGMMYAEGTGVKRDKQKALEWWQKAADNGSGHAKHNIEMFYKYDEIYGSENDFGIAVDYDSLYDE